MCTCNYPTKVLEVKFNIKFKYNEHQWCQTLGAVRFIVMTYYTQVHVAIKTIVTTSLIVVHSDNLNEHFGYSLTGGMI